MKIRREKNIDIIKNNTRKITPMMRNRALYDKKKFKEKSVSVTVSEIVGDEQRKMKSVSVLA